MRKGNLSVPSSSVHVAQDKNPYFLLQSRSQIGLKRFCLPYLSACGSPLLGGPKINCTEGPRKSISAKFYNSRTKALITKLLVHELLYSKTYNVL